MGKDQKNPRNPRLKRFVGVAEVCDALGFSRSTFSRLRNDGAFPPHTQLSASRIGWPVEVIEQHLATQARCVASRGVVDPQDLEPDQLVDSARSLLAQAMSKRDGKLVDPAGMSIHTSRAVTMDVFKAAEDEVARELFQSPDMLRQLGSLALHDDDWNEAQAKLLAAGRPAK